MEIFFFFGITPGICNSNFFLHCVVNLSILYSLAHIHTAGKLLKLKATDVIVGIQNPCVKIP